MRQVITSAAIQQEVRAGEGDLPALMVRYQGGEAVAIEELVRRLSPALLRFFWFSQRSTMEAEDLLQDCWLRIHRSRHTYRPPEPVLPWIFAIARHTRLDGYRRSRRRSAREVLVAEPPETAPVEAEKGGDDGEAMRELLNRLPPPQREVIVMLKMSGMSLQEVARAISSSVGAVKQKAHRAYANLRRMLDEKRENKDA
jgi:RNA polymerase sigma-70 factor (ECF subfamily)